MKKRYNKYYYQGEWVVWLITLSAFGVMATFELLSSIGSIIAVLLLRFVVFVNAKLRDAGESGVKQH